MFVFDRKKFRHFSGENFSSICKKENIACFTVKSRIFFCLRKVAGTFKRIIPRPLIRIIKNRIVSKTIYQFVKFKKAPYILGKYPRGVNLIGSIKAEMGLGQGCRLLAKMIKESQYKFSIYNYSFEGKASENDSSFDEYISEELPYGINIFHVNPCETGELFMKMPEAWNERYNIAYWLWELEKFPEEWIPYSQLFDEIWTPSEFTAKGIREAVNIPVYVVPYCVEAPFRTDMTRKSFHLPEDKFLFLIMYDVNSTNGRKNPEGAIQAYKEAFPPDNDCVGLVVKINNAKGKNLRFLQKQLKEYNNIFYITETMKKEEVNSLIKCVNVFVSLHRAEGFGLVMAEAMLLGTPVIATNWSSNVEFMSRTVACMVDYELVRNSKNEGLYPKGCIWAEPNWKQAAEYMHRLWTNEEFYQSIGKEAQKHIEKQLSHEDIVQTLRDRLKRRENGSGEN